MCYINLYAFSHPSTLRTMVELPHTAYSLRQMYLLSRACCLAHLKDTILSVHHEKIILHICLQVISSLYMFLHMQTCSKSGPKSSPCSFFPGVNECIAVIYCQPSPSDQQQQHQSLSINVLSCTWPLSNFTYLRAFYRVLILKYVGWKAGELTQGI